MRLAINLSKVELKMSQDAVIDAVTGKMGLGWLTHSMKAFGVGKIVSDGYRKKSNARLRGENNRLIMQALKELDEEELTYDNDATYFDSEKDSANYSYQKRKQFSGLSARHHDGM